MTNDKTVQRHKHDIMPHDITVHKWYTTKRKLGNTTKCRSTQ